MKILFIALMSIAGAALVSNTATAQETTATVAASFSQSSTLLVQPQTGASGNFAADKRVTGSAAKLQPVQSPIALRPVAIDPQTSRDRLLDIAKSINADLSQRSQPADEMILIRLPL